MCSVGFAERDVVLGSSLEDCVKGGWAGEVDNHAMFSRKALKVHQPCSVVFAVFKLQMLPVAGKCVWPSSTVGGIKKSRMTAPLPHSYLLYHGLQQLRWAPT